MAVGSSIPTFAITKVLDWNPASTLGIAMKIMLEDRTTGLMTSLFRKAPSTALDLHEHVESGLTYVLAFFLKRNLFLGSKAKWQELR